MWIKKKKEGNLNYILKNNMLQKSVGSGKRITIKMLNTWTDACCSVLLELLINGHKTKACCSWLGCLRICYIHFELLSMEFASRHRFRMNRWKEILGSPTLQFLHFSFCTDWNSLPYLTFTATELPMNSLLEFWLQGFFFIKRKKRKTDLFTVWPINIIDIFWWKTIITNFIKNWEILGHFCTKNVYYNKLLW